LPQGFHVCICGAGVPVQARKVRQRSTPELHAAEVARARKYGRARRLRRRLQALASENGYPVRGELSLNHGVDR
jgi:hypothetical protein